MMGNEVHLSISQKVFVDRFCYTTVEKGPTETKTFLFLSSVVT
jgi:hypothetical protein